MAADAKAAKTAPIVAQSRELERAYFDEFYPRDERVPRLRHLPDSRLFHNTELHTEDELETSAAYNELLGRHHGGNAIVVRLDGPNGRRWPGPALWARRLRICLTPPGWASCSSTGAGGSTMLRRSGWSSTWQAKPASIRPWWRRLSGSRERRAGWRCCWPKARPSARWPRRRAAWKARSART